MSDYFYDAVYWTGCPAFWVSSRPVVLHAHRADRPGGFVLASNHTSPYDVPILIRHTPRRMDWLSIVEFTRNRMVGRFFRLMNAVFLDRSRPGHEALRACVDKLRAGRVVTVFPEGGLRPQESGVARGGPFKPGVAWTAHKAGVPLVPVVLQDTRAYAKPWNWLPLAGVKYGVAYGRPIDPRADLPEREAVRLICADLRQAYLDLHRELIDVMEGRAPMPDEAQVRNEDRAVARTWDTPPTAAPATPAPAGSHEPSNGHGKPGRNGHAAPPAANGNPGAIAPHGMLHQFYHDDRGKVRFVRELFNDGAAEYEHIEKLSSLGTGAWYRGMALQRAGLKHGMKMLDVATGPGIILRQGVRLTGSARNVVGLDPSEGMLRQAHREGHPLLIQGRAEELPVPDDTFDFLSMGYALRHVLDLRTTFAEFYRVLKPGGRVCLLEITVPEGRFGRAAVQVYLQRLVPSLARLAGQARNRKVFWQYHWDTVETCVPPRDVMEAIASVGFTDVTRHIELGIFSEYRATKPPGSSPDVISEPHSNHGGRGGHGENLKNS